MYIGTCLVRSDSYKCKTKYAFFYDSHFKSLHQSKCCEAFVENRADAPICVLEDKELETKLNLRHSLKSFFGGKCTVEYVYKINPC